jgi:hypothetical protein
MTAERDWVDWHEHYDNAPSAVGPTRLLSDASAPFQMSTRRGRRGSARVQWEPAPTASPSLSTKAGQGSRKSTRKSGDNAEAMGVEPCPDTADKLPDLRGFAGLERS